MALRRTGSGQSGGLEDLLQNGDLDIDVDMDMEEENLLLTICNEVDGFCYVSLNVC